MNNRVMVMVKSVTWNCFPATSIVQPVGMDASGITAWFRDLSGNVMGLYQHRG